MIQSKEDLEAATEIFFGRPNNTYYAPQVAPRNWWEMSCEECDQIIMQGRRSRGPDEECAVQHQINCPTHRERWDRLAKEFREDRFPRLRLNL